MLWNAKRLVVGGLLMLLPVVAVHLMKQSKWGPIFATPQPRQQGAANAKVVIVEYSDFQCPSCASIQPFLHQLLERYQGKIRLIYKYYPLTKIHPNAMPAAHAAECAASQSKFWPYHDRLFATQSAWSSLPDPTTSFMAIAQETLLDVERFKQCWADPSKRQAAERDSAEARARGVSATPTFFVGDERLVGGVFMNDAARIIERELRK